MTAVAKAREYIANIPKDQPFSAKVLREFAETDNIRQILSRLVKSGELKRVARGIYVKPKKIKKIGEILPSAEYITRVLAESTGEVVVIHGAEAARRLQLTTQVPMRLVFYTSGNTRILNIGNRMVKLIHANPNRLIAPGTKAGLVISALWYLGKDNVTKKTIRIIKRRISKKDYKEVVKLIERMPDWMADVFYRYRHKRKYRKRKK